MKNLNIETAKTLDVTFSLRGFTHEKRINKLKSKVAVYYIGTHFHYTQYYLMGNHSKKTKFSVESTLDYLSTCLEFSTSANFMGQYC